MKVFFLTALSILFLASCSEYTQILKGDDYEKKFSFANDKFDNRHWSQSIALYEQVYQHAPKSSQGEVSYFRVGKAYFNAEDYYMAGYYFGAFFEKYPYSSNVEEAFFLKAICSVNNSPASSLDQQETELALNDVQQFIYLFPNSKRIDTCNQIMDKLRLKLEGKELDNIRLYAKTMNYRAAATSAETFLATYPASMHREEVNFIMIKNTYLLTTNSIEEKFVERIVKTVDLCRNFSMNYPQSEKLSEVSGYDKEMQLLLFQFIEKALSNAKEYVQTKEYLDAKSEDKEKKKIQINKTIETYRTFVALFPGSEYIQKLESQKIELQKLLDSTTN